VQAEPATNRGRSSPSILFCVAGRLFYVLGLGGLLLLLLVVMVQLPSTSARTGTPVPGGNASQPVAAPPGALAPSEARSNEGTLPSPVADGSKPTAFRPISGLHLPRIGLETEVVTAPWIVDQDGGTWEIPKFVAGHAEFTAGAGQKGNAVLFGHITSLTLGNVFEQLDRARVGDDVEIYSGDLRFDYRVMEVKRVPRTEVSVVDPTETPTVTLITCAGVWLPLLHDYAERLVVRAELVGADQKSV
jgi:sortase A